VTLDGLLAAAAGDRRGAFPELANELLHPGASTLEHLVPLGVRREDSHALSLQPRRDDSRAALLSLSAASPILRWCDAVSRSCSCLLPSHRPRPPLPRRRP
jgi:hypothetical protein